MRRLLDEIRMRFPELMKEGKELDEELPYLAMGDLVDWLDSIGTGGFAPTIVQRVVDFAEWCELQPRGDGDTAKDDIYTVLVVELYEGLFLHEYTKALIPRLMTKARLDENKQYLVSWVGQDNYDKALEQF